MDIISEDADTEKGRGGVRFDSRHKLQASTVHDERKVLPCVGLRWQTWSAAEEGEPDEPIENTALATLLSKKCKEAAARRQQGPIALSVQEHAEFQSFFEKLRGHRGLTTRHCIKLEGERGE